MKRNPNRHADPTLRDAVDVTRYWNLVDKRCEDECWPWLGDTDGEYGIFQWHGKRTRAPELALSFTTGESRLARLDTCHSCHNPICCNPAHLRFDTRKNNVADMYEAGRQNNPARLSDEAVRTIRERREAGARQQDLAEQYGISSAYVSTIVRGLVRQEAGGPIQTERKYRKWQPEPR